ncbi:MAG TPA: FmdE family protein [Acidimicrobiales bacterium]|nr:FmdE family protein [Acidimicrobiales bacterium]
MTVKSASTCMCGELGPQTSRRKALDDATLDQVVRFHGHLCPGLAMGIHAANIALREIGPHSSDEEVVAVVETDMCGVDGIQFLTGCTFGKGNLIHHDYGKNAYTFFRRSDGRAVRIVGLPNAWPRDPEHQALFAKIRAGEATKAERARFRELHESQSHAVLALDPHQLYSVTEVHDEPPRRARIHTSVPCARCGEGAMETRVRRFGGDELCQPCFDAALAAN